MPGVSRVNLDTAGGLIVGNLAPTVYVETYNVVVIGAAVQPHGAAPHNNAVMVGGSTTVFANNIGVCRVGDLASCGHAATGSTTVFAN